MAKDEKQHSQREKRQNRVYVHKKGDGSYRRVEPKYGQIKLEAPGPWPPPPEKPTHQEGKPSTE